MAAPSYTLAEVSKLREAHPELLILKTSDNAQFLARLVDVGDVTAKFEVFGQISDAARTKPGCKRRAYTVTQADAEVASKNAAHPGRWEAFICLDECGAWHMRRKGSA